MLFNDAPREIKFIEWLEVLLFVLSVLERRMLGILYLLLQFSTSLFFILIEDFFSFTTFFLSLSISISVLESSNLEGKLILSDLNFNEISLIFFHLLLLWNLV